MENLPPNTIQKIKAMNINEVMLTGGECTIFPLFLKMLQYCKENEVKPSIFTNGFASNHEILNYVDSYCLSLDGLESNHNYLRGNSMGFKKTIDTIKYLQLNRVYQQPCASPQSYVYHYMIKLCKNQVFFD